MGHVTADGVDHAALETGRRDHGVAASAPGPARCTADRHAHVLQRRAGEALGEHRRPGHLEPDVRRPQRDDLDAGGPHDVDPAAVGTGAGPARPAQGQHHGVGGLDPLDAVAIGDEDAVVGPSPPRVPHPHHHPEPVEPRQPGPQQGRGPEPGREHPTAGPHERRLPEGLAPRPQIPRPERLDRRGQHRAGRAVPVEQPVDRLGVGQVEPAPTGHEQLAADRRHPLEHRRPGPRTGPGPRPPSARRAHLRSPPPATDRGSGTDRASPQTTEPGGTPIRQWGIAPTDRRRLVGDCRLMPSPTTPHDDVFHRLRPQHQGRRRCHCQCRRAPPGPADRPGPGRGARHRGAVALGVHHHPLRRRRPPRGQPGRRHPGDVAGHLVPAADADLLRRRRRAPRPQPAQRQRGVPPPSDASPAGAGAAPPAAGHRPHGRRRRSSAEATWSPRSS